MWRGCQRHRPPGGQPSAELPAEASRSMRPSYPPHVVLSRSILRISFVILSQHLLTWCKPLCPKKCSRSTSINKCRAPRVSDDTLSARHYATECIYSIYPGTKVWGSSAGHRSLQIRKQAAQSRRRSSAEGLLCLLCT